MQKNRVIQQSRWIQKTHPYRRKNRSRLLPPGRIITANAEESLRVQRALKVLCQKVSDSFFRLSLASCTKVCYDRCVVRQKWKCG